MRILFYRLQSSFARSHLVGSILCYLFFILIPITQNQVLAQITVTPPNCPGGLTCFDATDIQNRALTGSRGYQTQHGTTLAYYIAILWETAFIVAGLAFLAYLLLGAFRYLTAGGDQKATAEAKNILAHAVIGLGIIVGSFVIIRIVETIFGLTIVSGVIKFPRP